MAEFRIEYSIQRRDEGDEDFTEIGFGSSATWGTVDQAAYMLATDVEHRAWETREGMPEPESVGADGEDE